MLKRTNTHTYTVELSSSPSLSRLSHVSLPLCLLCLSSFALHNYLGGSNIILILNDYVSTVVLRMHSYACV